jgi:hypothetical protein
MRWLIVAELVLRKLYKGFAPMNKESFDIFNSLPMNAIFKAKLVKPKNLNSDDVTDEQRSIAQNRIMWAWLTDMERTIVNEFAGETKEVWDIRMKRKFLITIYERDCQSYAEMVGAVRKVYHKGLTDEVEIMLNFIAEKTSTRKGSVKQIAEYLTCIERLCHQRGITLRTDPEMYKLAVNWRSVYE